MPSIQPEYGYGGRIEEIRGQEYMIGDETYLDHAGATLYARSLVEESSKALLSNVYGNPHSRSPASERSTDMVHKTRMKVLDMLNADSTEYDVVFTANATAAVKLVAEGLASQKKGTRYWYLKDAHTSLIGLRNVAGEYAVVNDEMEMELELERLSKDQQEGLTLVSWPGQSNFSGRRYPVRSWVEKVVDNPAVYTLLDAAAQSSSNPPDLSGGHGPDFVALSFYKIFGLPDLGALVVKKERGKEFFANRVYFGGGTVESLTVAADFAPRHQNLGASLEDGSLPFHSILTLSIAFDVHCKVYGTSPFHRISNHTAALSQYLYDSLSQLRHPNGQPVCEIYSDGHYLDTTAQGPIVTFNLKDENGDWIGYSDFDGIASSSGINIRTGTLCNTGSTAHYVGITERNIIENHANGHICGDAEDVINGIPTGAIRASLGACSSKHDIDVLLTCLKEYYIQPTTETTTATDTTSSHFISDITLFPIKSCGAFHVPRGVPWELTKEGLKWDREFCLVDRSTYSVLALKKHPRMALIRPNIIEDTQNMEVHVEGSSQTLTIPMNAEPSTSPDIVSSRIMGESVKIVLYDSPEVVNFFSHAVGLDCTLARFPREGETDVLSTRYHKPHLNGPLNYNKESNGKQPDTSVPISMNNSSPLLLISKPSAFKLALDSDIDAIDPNIFRGNIVISGKNLSPYVEDTWSALTINDRNISFKVSSV
ncbi:hypothetical protein TRICI_006365 [Trichomonascus ciferrii]|uniref:MOSC domain-containing protein n=1 Tax=Trichomonascus ciferrii TaxID=44093 RepID=A0A642UHJ8_9ASCO|nr:hypothetical protein TRICI_006365 [Trichomonascus ciferrii]